MPSLQHQACNTKPAAPRPQHQDLSKSTSRGGLLANTERAHARGAFGSPTFFVGDDIYFGRDRLREVEEAIAPLR